MKFEKAKPEQGWLKVAIYGPPGAGKTFSTLLMVEGLAKRRGTRPAVVDTERGTDFYAKKSPRSVHPEPFDFDAIYTRSLADVTEAVMALDPAVHGPIVIDSMTHFWEGAIEAYEGDKTKADTIPMHAWGKIKKPYKELVKWLMASPFDVFILGRQGNVFENEGGELKKTGVKMKAEGDTPYEPHICLRMECKQDRADPTKSTYLMYAEKDRTGVLAGRTFANPSYATIEPLLALLGDTQAAAEDEDERIARDAELMRKEEAKKEKKVEKSATLLAEGLDAIAKCAAMAELEIAHAAISKQVRYLTPNDKATMNGVYKQKRLSLSPKDL